MENTQQQQKGPWLIFGDELIDHDDYSNCLMGMTDDKEDHQAKTNEATDGNVDLTYVPVKMAIAAPDLFEALKSLSSQVMQDCSIGSDPQYLTLCEKVQKALQVIKKASQDIPVGSLRYQWHMNKKFVYKGLTYTKGVNDSSAEVILNGVEPFKKGDRVYVWDEYKTYIPASSGSSMTSGKYQGGRAYGTIDSVDGITAQVLYDDMEELTEERWQDLRVDK